VEEWLDGLALGSVMLPPDVEILLEGGHEEGEEAGRPALLVVPLGGLLAARGCGGGIEFSKQLSPELVSLAWYRGGAASQYGTNSVDSVTDPHTFYADPDTVSGSHNRIQGPR